LELTLNKNVTNCYVYRSTSLVVTYLAESCCVFQQWSFSPSRGDGHHALCHYDTTHDHPAAHLLCAHHLLNTVQ